MMCRTEKAECTLAAFQAAAAPDPSSSSPPPSPSAPGSPSLPPNASLSQRLKYLIKTYGWYALGVYIVLSTLDFAVAFAEAQDVIALRVRTGWIWPWLELFKDRTIAPMRVVDAYLVPILEGALKKAKEEKEAGLASEIKAGEVGEDDTLLDHLVRLTHGTVLLSLIYPSGR